MQKFLLLSIVILQILACSQEIGGEKWCSNLEAKAKGDWTINEAKDYAKHCLFKVE